MSPAMLRYSLSLGIAFAISVLLTLAVRTVARRARWIARPRPDRWHDQPTALFGGVAIYGGFLAAFLFDRPASLRGDALLVVCASAMFLLGLVDDRLNLKPFAKLIAQIACAAAFTTWGLRLHWLSHPVLDQGLTIFWLVGVTNALNLLDNMDGAAGGVAAIAGAFMIYLCHRAGEVQSALMAAAFTGAVLGFLRFNVHPASIFMGDSGSLFLGFFLGGLALVTTKEAGAGGDLVAMLAAPVLPLLLPILDTALVAITRHYHGRRISQGGIDHTAHRLVALGLSEWQATLVLWLLAASSGGVAVVAQALPVSVATALIVLFALALVSIAVVLGRVRVYEPASERPPIESAGFERPARTEPGTGETPSFRN